MDVLKLDSDTGPLLKTGYQDEIIKPGLTFRLISDYLVFGFNSDFFQNAKQS